MEDLVLQMPQTLKKQLVDDCEFITDLGKVLWIHYSNLNLYLWFIHDEIPVNDINILLQLVKLPRTPNVDDIFKKYLDYRSKKDSK